MEEIAVRSPGEGRQRDEPLPAAHTDGPLVDVEPHTLRGDPGLLELEVGGVLESPQ